MFLLLVLAVLFLWSKSQLSFSYPSWSICIILFKTSYLLLKSTEALKLPLLLFVLNYLKSITFLGETVAVLFLPICIVLVEFLKIYFILALSLDLSFKTNDWKSSLSTVFNCLSVFNGMSILGSRVLLSSFHIIGLEFLFLF